MSNLQLRTSSVDNSVEILNDGNSNHNINQYAQLEIRDNNVENNEQRSVIQSNLVPKFICKLSQILSENEYEKWIRWDSKGEIVRIENPKKFILKVAPKFFKQTSFISFVR